MTLACGRVSLCELQAAEHRVDKVPGQDSTSSASQLFTSAGTLPEVHEAQSNSDVFSRLLSLLQSQHFREMDSLRAEILALHTQIEAQRPMYLSGQLSTGTDVVGSDQLHVWGELQEPLSPQQLDLVMEEAAQKPTDIDKGMGNLERPASRGNDASTCADFNSGEPLPRAASVCVAGAAESDDMFDGMPIKAVASLLSGQVADDMFGSEVPKIATQLSIVEKSIGEGEVRKSSKLCKLAEDMNADRRDHHFQDLQEQIRKTTQKRSRGSSSVKKSVANQDVILFEGGTSSTSSGRARKPKTFTVFIVSHPAFDIMSAVAIVLNSALIGVITQHLTHGNSEEMWMEVSAWTLATFFAVELVIRWCALGHRKFFLGEEKSGNVFDLCLVLLSVVELFIQSIGGNKSSIPLVNSGAKILKMLRIIRIFRVFRFFRELSLLALMIMDSIKSLFWALLLIGIILYVFAIFFTQQAAEHNKQENAKNSGDQHMFGSLQSSTYWLICSMLGGISWYEVSDTLFDIGWVPSAFFLVFIFFSMLCVLNIITGVFVDNAVATAELERDFLVEKELELKSKYIHELKSLFAEMDTDQSATITWEEFHTSFQDPRVASYFTAIGLHHADDLERLWMLLDDDKAGGIDVQEFLDGCQRLRGEARSLDVQTVLHECKRIRASLEMILKSNGHGEHLV